MGHEDEERSDWDGSPMSLKRKDAFMGVLKQKEGVQARKMGKETSDTDRAKDRETSPRAPESMCSGMRR